MNELLPCPFCGGNATLWSDGYMEYVECDVCGAKSKSCYDPQLAVRKWSTRYGWVPVRTCRNESADGFLCSACSFGDFASFGYKPNYCPKCGAKVVTE